MMTMITVLENSESGIGYGFSVSNLFVGLQNAAEHGLAYGWIRVFLCLRLCKSFYKINTVYNFFYQTLYKYKKANTKFVSVKKNQVTVGYQTKVGLKRNVSWTVVFPVCTILHNILTFPVSCAQYTLMEKSATAGIHAW